MKFWCQYERHAFFKMTANITALLGIQNRWICIIVPDKGRQNSRAPTDMVKYIILRKRQATMKTEILLNC